MDKRAILNHLQKLAFAAEVLDEEHLNAKGLSAAAWTLRSVEGDLAELHRSGALAERRDVVKQAKVVVGALVEQGVDQPGEEVMARVPPGLFDVRRIKGLGPKKVRVLWKELGITSLAELEYACTENRLLDLKGFGKKTQEKVLAGIEEVRSYLGRFRLDQIEQIAGLVLEALEPAVEELAVVGDLRRSTETVDKLELAWLGDLANVNAALAPLAENDEDDEGEDKAEGDSLVIEGAAVVLHECPHRDAWGATLVVTTGSQAHVDALAARAEERGLQLSVSGLRRGEELVPTPDEEALYRALGLVPTAPERREAGVPLVEEGKDKPRLIRRQDLLGAIHNHTTASDGIHTLAEMRQGALDAGLSYLGITEHSQTAAYAGGLTPDDLARQRAEVDKLNAEEGAGCTVVHGVESDILMDGALDYEDQVLAALDVVVASVHQRHGLDQEGFTARMVAAARHPASDIVGHPTGRMLLGRAPSEYDMEAMLDACAETGTAVELNAQPARLDLNEEHLALAKAKGVLVSIAADAHSVQALGFLDYGVRIARRAGLTPDDVLNARPWPAVKAWLAERRQRAAAG